MAEREAAGDVERPMLRRAIRHALRRLEPEIRVVAEDFLALASPIDLLGVGREGELVSIRIARPGEEGGLFAHALADLGWLGPRSKDFAKLAPGLGLAPSAAPRALLLAPSLAPEVVVAAAVVTPATVELRRYQCWRERGQLTAQIEASVRPASTAPTGAPSVEREAAASPTVADRPRPPVAASPQPVPAASSDDGGFRTGLRDEDLRLEDLEPGSRAPAARDDAGQSVAIN